MSKMRKEIYLDFKECCLLMWSKINGCFKGIKGDARMSKYKTWKQALEESIEHHKDNLKKLQEHDGDILNDSIYNQFVLLSDNGVEIGYVVYNEDVCSLCNRNDMNFCIRCPLFKVEGKKRCGDNGTAWKKLYDAKTKKEVIEAEKAMIKKLIEARKFVR